MTQVLRAKHLVGDIVLDEHGSIVEHPSKKQVPVVTEQTWPKVLMALKDERFFPVFHRKNIECSRRQVRESVSADVGIMQAVSAIEEIDRCANMVSRRLREWAGWYMPEASRVMVDHRVFANAVVDHDQAWLLDKAGVIMSDSMGASLSKLDESAIKMQARMIQSLFAVRDQIESHLKKVMEGVCPNVYAVAGHLIGAKLVVHAGSLRRLAEMPSSTMQILGAEKALFRHLRTGARPPKYGVLFSHPLVQSAKRQDQGRVARALADKLSIAARVDFFKGAFVGDKLKRGLESRFSSVGKGVDAHQQKSKKGGRA